MRSMLAELGALLDPNQTHECRRTPVDYTKACEMPRSKAK